MADEAPGRVSVVVPAYNEADRIGSTLTILVRDGPRLGIAELIVVDDGSTDATAATVEARAAVAAIPIHLLRLPRNRGKGAAIKAGIAEASGDYVAFIDADLSASPGAIPRAVAALEAGADIAIGTRVALDGGDARRTQPLARRLSGRVFVTAQRLIVGLPYADTQCPFKLFTRAAAQRVFPEVQASGWAFDVELLARARHAGLTIEQLPVTWSHVGGSRLHIGPRTALAVLWELVGIRRRLGRAR